MAHPHIVVWLLAADYPAFRDLLPDEPKLPQKYASWLARVIAEKKQIVDNGDTFTEVTVIPSEFSKYCADTNQLPSYVMLEATAVALSRGR